MTSETTREQPFIGWMCVGCRKAYPNKIDAVTCHDSHKPTPPRDDAWCLEFVRKCFEAKATVEDEGLNEDKAIDEYAAELSARWPGATGFPGEVVEADWRRGKEHDDAIPKNNRPDAC